MSASLRWTGLDDLQQALRTLPSALAGEAAGIVRDEATAAGAEIQAAYPARTGRLRRGVKVIGDMTSSGAIYRVRSTARHADLFEIGTQARHTAIGANRGSMPPGRVFVPVVVRRRRAMFRRLIEVVKRSGAKVTGDV